MNNRQAINYSIIIPVKAINNYIRETVAYIQGFKRKDWELIVLPNEDEPTEWDDSHIRIVASGKVGPARKRDMGAEAAAGQFLVFLDDDSYPEPDLLDVADRYFTDNNVVALGGPAVTPPNDSFWQRVSGAVFLSRFSGGVPERYVPVGQVKQVDDWPSVNLMVRKDAFLDIGGFNSPFWPGEDTKLCLDLIKKTGKKILYVPEMKVWHHRRAGLFAHIEQIGAYGLHRGYFAKKYPETSRRLLYMIPSAFAVFVILTPLSFFFEVMSSWLFLAGWGMYFLVILKAISDICKYEKMAVGCVASYYIFCTHVWYGIRFLQGLMTNNLVSRLR
jgi:GT2 family glycosyltransferase